MKSSKQRIILLRILSPYRKIIKIVLFTSSGLAWSQRQSHIINGNISTVTGAPYTFKDDLVCIGWCDSQLSLNPLISLSPFLGPQWCAQAGGSTL